MVHEKPKLGNSVIVGKDVQFGKDVIIWNFVVIGDNTRIGNRTRIASFCDIGKNVVIGDECNIQTHVTISNGCKIGNKVFIGPNSTLLNDKFPQCDHITPPMVKEGAIIGGGAIVLPKVTIGRNSVIGAGSVVTRNVSHEVVVMGVPARKVMTKKEYNAKRASFVDSRK
jgi:acetyltransferase-like isoleucine patch superfamily enzyme